MVRKRTQSKNYFVKVCAIILTIVYTVSVYSIVAMARGSESQDSKNSKSSSVQESISSTNSKAASIPSASANVQTIVSKRGNSTNNLNIDGAMASDEKWVYYRNMGRSEQVPGKFEYRYTVNPGIFAFPLDGTGEPTRITDSIKENLSSERNLSVMDGWIYYIAERKTKKNPETNIEGSEMLICRSSIDEEKKFEVLYTTGDITSTNSNLIRFLIVDGWIYYNVVEPSSDFSNKNNIYRMKLNGDGKVLLTESSNKSFEVEGEWIYYEGYGSFGSTIMRMKLDGTKKKEMVFDSSFITDKYIIDDGWLYFHRYDIICRVPLKKNVKASELKEIVKLENYGACLDYFIVHKGWVYYCDEAKNIQDDYGFPVSILQRVRIDGKDNMVVYKDNDFFYQRVQLINDCLYSPSALDSIQPAKHYIRIEE